MSIYRPYLKFQSAAGPDTAYCAIGRTEGRLSGSSAECIHTRYFPDHPFWNTTIRLAARADQHLLVKAMFRNLSKYREIIARDTENPAPRVAASYDWRGDWQTAVSSWLLFKFKMVSGSERETSAVTIRDSIAAPCCLVHLPSIYSLGLSATTHTSMFQGLSMARKSVYP